MLSNATLPVLLRRALIFLGSYDRASWAKYEESKTNKMQQLDVYY